METPHWGTRGSSCLGCLHGADTGALLHFTTQCRQSQVLAVSFPSLQPSLHLLKSGMSFDFPATPTPLHGGRSWCSPGGQELLLLPTPHNAMPAAFPHGPAPCTAEPQIPEWRSRCRWDRAKWPKKIGPGLTEPLQGPAR